MFASWGNWLGDDTRTAGTQNLRDSVITTNKNITTRLHVPIYSKYSGAIWRTDAEMQRHYWTASFFLPIGSIFILGVVVLLMVLFKRCPHTIAAIVAAILGIIIILATLMSLNHTPVYS